ncbi:tetratricopeptide repeat protein [Kitasatospora sp. NPDC059673]|uniref:tetratricopeptide repeat protein n=1 Tax=Kitasatospora sp. NPDC059673 TaxID=3346901 RepID=UPI0036894AAB
MSALEDRAVAASRSVDPARWRALFDQAVARIAGVFGRVEPRATARARLLGLLSGTERKNCWQLAEHAGHARPRPMQRLLRTARWDVAEVRDEVRRYVLEKRGAVGRPLPDARTGAPEWALLPHGVELLADLFRQTDQLSCDAERTRTREGHVLQHLITQDDHLRMVPIDRGELITVVSRFRQELDVTTDPSRTRLLTREIGIAQMTLGNHDEARTLLRKSLDMAAADGNTRSVVASGINLGDAHRYAGDVQAADALYRSALATARSRHPELLDFALQHFGKHLMELGDLTKAQTCLQEALRLRIAKGNPELVGSTQAALDRVALLLGRANPNSSAPHG